MERARSMNISHVDRSIGYKQGGLPGDDGHARGRASRARQAESRDAAMAPEGAGPIRATSNLKPAPLDRGASGRLRSMRSPMEPVSARAGALSEGCAQRRIHLSFTTSTPWPSGAGVAVILGRSTEAGFAQSPLLPGTMGSAMPSITAGMPEGDSLSNCSI